MSDFSSMSPGVSGAVGSANRVSPTALSLGVTKPASTIEIAANAVPPVGADRVELSDVARHLDYLRQLPAVREHLVAQVRQSIDAGTYESEDKLDAAIDRLAEEELL